MSHGYPDLFNQFGWAVGVYRAPSGYQHPWLAVGRHGTSGAWTKREARTIRRLQRCLESSRKILDRTTDKQAGSA